MNREQVRGLLCEDLGSGEELERLLSLFQVFAQSGPPPDPLGLYPRYKEFLDSFLLSLDGSDGELIEESFLRLYEHLHGREAPYSPGERKRMDQTGGYWNHAGGLSPVLKSGAYLKPDSVSADFGAGNGLQLLLMQKLAPHKRSVQFEISSQAMESGRILQDWLGIEPGRVDWVAGDILNAPMGGLDFIYLYRPVRPEGEGLLFYRRLGKELARAEHPVIIFSIADCLAEFLTPRAEVIYGDGHLTCYRLAR